MTLRRIFSQDDDFKESMFARQMAVMKGQAWNVVETLKHPDHGPLELTRRTRVCVWDDLVDVPVAIPLRAPSNEAQRNKARQYDPDHEEMDIGAAMSLPSDNDLLGLNAPSHSLPNPNRFELSRGGQHEPHKAGMHAGSPATIGANDIITRDSIDDLAGVQDRDPDRSWGTPPPRAKNNHRKHDSLSSVRSQAAFVFGSDDEGDLGYAAAEGMEGNQRKVIVERIEAVKSKNPVFTWC